MSDHSPRYFIGYTDEADWHIFSQGKQTTFGFTDAKRSSAEKLRPGDVLVCYLRGLMAWCGLLEVTPSTDIPDGTTRDRIAKYPVRVHVRPLIVLPVFKAISITEEPVWNALSLTKGKTRSPGWNAAFRSDLAGLSEQDGEYLVHAIQARYGAPIGPKAAADDPPYTPSTEDDRERVDFRVELTRVFH